jgi:acyl-CoA synthetase (AMP-forming)/AMP-acid ligase II
MLMLGIRDAVTKFKRPTASWPENLQWISTDDKSNKSTGKFQRKEYLDYKSADVAFLQYTSGSTSEPKGVIITHGNLAHNLSIITNELNAVEDTIVVSWLPQYHDMVGVAKSCVWVQYLFLNLLFPRD